MVMHDVCIMAAREDDKPGHSDRDRYKEEERDRG